MGINIYTRFFIAQEGIRFGTKISLLKVFWVEKHAISRLTVCAVYKYSVGGKADGTWMGKFERFEKVGLRDKETKALIAVYPKRPEGTDEQIEADVKYWYYQRNCSAEEELKGLFVDHLTEHELKSIQ